MRHLALIALICLALIPLGCGSEPVYPPPPPGVPMIRVLLMSSQSSVQIAANHPAMHIGTSRLPLALSVDTSVPISLGPTGWRIGNQQTIFGELTIETPASGAIAVNGQAYRGRVRLVPSGNGNFDVINDVDVDGYLKGVIAKEMLSGWQDEAYKAQAIVARTYAIYEAETSGRARHWDVMDDQRSQVYGGISGETDRARRAVDATTGVVVAYGPPGDEKIFKAYFSACCGGVSENPSEAFGEPFHPTMTDQNVGTLCSASPRFTWGPIVISKDEMTRRIKLWGKQKNRGEQNLTHLVRIDKQLVNAFGRPVRFLITDASGTRYSLSAEELRWAVNTDAPQGSTMFSGFVEPAEQGSAVRFTGHGSGHGVGMCQWCAETRAERGLLHEDIVLLAFPGSKLIRAY